MDNNYHEPGSSGTNLLFAAIFLVFGLIWTISSISVVSESPFGIGYIYPVLGIVFVTIGIVQGVKYFRGSMKNRAAASQEGDSSDSWIIDETRNDDG